MYTVAIVSLAIDAPEKWTDNLLSHHRVPDVVSGQRGVPRKISHAGLIRLGVVRQLHAALGLSVASALDCADLLLRNGTATIGALTLALDLAAVEHIIDIRLADALESAPAPRRGRPGKRRATM